MNLKISLLATLLLIFGSITTVTAQEYKTEVDLIQDAFGKVKKDIVTSFLDESTRDNSSFWTLYNSYEAARKTMAQKRLNLIAQYVMTYSSESVSDEAIKSLMKQSFRLGNQSEKLIMKYAHKLSKQVSPLVGMQFAQVENYIRSTLDSKILESVPMM